MVLDRAERIDADTHRDDRFDELFRALYGRLYGLVYRVLGDRSETEDTLQEAFFKLAGSTARGLGDDESAAWLRRVCLNLSLNRIRDEGRARARLERSARLDGADLMIDPAEPAQHVLRREEQADVRRALASLPVRQRDCLLLRYSGFSYAEIAATLGIAVGSVGVILARAERAFRKSYQELFDGLS